MFTCDMPMSCGLCIFLVHFLSLYSTAMQNTWRRGLVLGNAPDARILHGRYQHVGIFWRYPLTPIPDANPKICVTPDANPRRQSVEYRCSGYPTQNFRVGHVHFMFFCRFHLRLVANANPVSSGIWALLFTLWVPC